MKKVTFRFINDPAAQVAALLAGDIDGMPRYGALESLKQFQGDPRFSVDRRRHRRQDDHDDQQQEEAASTTCACAARSPRRSTARRSSTARQEGFGMPIGSHMVPSDAGYVDLTGVNPYNPEKAKALLKEAGVTTPLERDADAAAAALRAQGRRDHRLAAGQGRHRRQDRERRVGAVAVGHLQGQLRPDRSSATSSRSTSTATPTPSYYYGYDSKAYRDLLDQRTTTTADAEGARLKLLGDIQRQLATDSVNAFLFQLPQFAVANKRLKGLWSSSPIFANDLAALSWQ